MALTHITLATRVATVLAVALVAGSAWYVRGVEPGITFATNGINLKVNSQSWYNGATVPSATWEQKDLVPGSDKFFNFDDIKPGDYGCNVISLHANKNAWMCLNFDNLVESENGVNEPEGQVDVSAGAELADGTEFFGWADDGDGVYEPPGENALFGTSTQAASSVLDNTTYVVCDAGTGSCTLNTTRYVGMCWCAGNLSVNPTTGATSCDATTLGNAAQTDSFTVDVSILAESASEKPQFTCDGVPPPPPPPPKKRGLGEQIGLYVKCQVLAQYGWPLPTYGTECPNGFNSGTSSAESQSAQPASTPRAPRTR